MVYSILLSSKGILCNLHVHVVSILVPLCNSQCKRSEPYGNGALNACCMYVPKNL